MKFLTSALRTPIFITVVLTAILFLAGSSFAERVLYHFKGHGSDVNGPYYPMVEKNGRLYGVSGGGNFGEGGVFELKSPDVKGAPWTERLLHSFHESSVDGGFPTSGLVVDDQGNLYGTLERGGAHGYGAVYQLSPPVPPSTKWTETLIYSPSSKAVGRYPNGLTMGPRGQLYGTTELGGSRDWGTVFELRRDQNGAWTERVLFSFGSYPGAGRAPALGLVADQAGNLYGLTWAGGTPLSCGNLYELQAPAAPGARWTEVVLYKFSCRASPSGGLALDSAGNLYWVSISVSNGAVYEISPNGDGTWTESTVYAFLGGSDGDRPTGAMLTDQAGNLYGTTERGGFITNTCYLGCGTVYRLSPGVGGTWTETQLYQFGSRTGGPGDGASPSGNLIFGPYGDLYGGTSSGSGDSHKNGVAFSVHP